SARDRAAVHASPCPSPGRTPAPRPSGRFQNRRNVCTGSAGADDSFHPPAGADRATPMATVRRRPGRRGLRSLSSRIVCPPVRASEVLWSVLGNEAGGGWDHRRWSFVNGLDDLGVVDAAQVGRGDPEVGVAELALDDDEWHAFAGHLNGVGVPELVRCEPPAYTGSPVAGS